MIENVFLKAADKAAREEMKAAVLDSGRVSCQSVGKSIMGESIDLYSIGEGRGRVIYFGAHHALESITCNLLFTFMYELATGKINSFGRDLSTLMSLYTYSVVPCVNPDGIEMRYHGVDASPIKDRQMNMSGGSFDSWQANARGVDLNHNYNAGFYSYKSVEKEKGITPGSTLYSGEYPESEPESRTAANLLRTLAPSAVVSLHSQGEEIYFSPKTKTVSRIASRLCDTLGYRLSVPKGTAAYGGLCDFAGNIGIPSFTIEVGKGKNPLSEKTVSGIYSRISGSLLLLPTML